MRAGTHQSPLGGTNHLESPQVQYLAALRLPIRAGTSCLSQYHLSLLALLMFCIATADPL